MKLIPTKSDHLRVVFTSGFLLIAPVFQAATQNAQEKDLEFASKLKDYYIDLADDFVAKLEKNTDLKDDLKARLKLVRAEISMKRASIEPVLEKKLEYIQQADQSVESFIGQNPDHPFIAQARNTKGELGRLAGEAILEAIAAATDPKTIQTLREKGEKFFQDAEQLLRKQISKGADPNVEFDLAFATARLNLPKTQFRHALLYEAKSSKRTGLLQDSLRNLDEALFDVGDPYFPATYDAYTTKGLIHRELGDWAKARESFEQAINMKDLYVDAEDPEKHNWDDIGPALIAKGFVELAKAGNIFQDYLAVIDAAERCFRLLPDVKSVDLGWALLLEQAQALQASGQSEEAQKALNSVIQSNGPGFYGRKARDLTSQWIVGEGATASQWLIAARSEFQKGNYDRGIDFLKRAVRRSEDPKTSAECYYQLGLYLDFDRRDEEAALAFLHVPKVLASSERAPDALYRAATNLIQLAADGSTFYEGHYQKAINELTTKYADSKEAKQAELFVAKKSMRQKKWADALKILESVAESSPNYPVALRDIPLSYYSIALEQVKQARPVQAKEAFLKAEKAYRKAYDWANAQATKSADSSRQSEMKALAFASLVQISEIYLQDAVAKPADALKTIDGAEKQYTEAEYLSKITTLRIRAYSDLNQFEEATTALDSLLAKSAPSQKGISALCRELAARLEKSVEEREKKNPNAARGLDPKSITELRKAAVYYHEWINRAAASKELRRGAEDILVAADRLDVIGFRANGLSEAGVSVVDLEGLALANSEYWKQASNLYEQLLKPPHRDSLGTKVWAVRVKLGRCYLMLTDWAKASAAYEGLIQGENMTNPLTGQLNVAAVRAKPDLLGAYAGYGFALFQQAKPKKDEKLFNAAREVFTRIQENTQDDNKLWWQARYLIVSAFFEQGDYASAKTVTDSILRLYPDWDGNRFDLKKRFQSLKDRVDARTPR